METKMVIVIREDLRNIKGEKPKRGKIIAQAAHSTLGFVWENLKGRKICFELSDEQFAWVNQGQTKITLKAKDEDELLKVYQEAKNAGLTVELIIDEGRTEFDGPTKTCISIGPNYAEKINKITGHLSTY